MENKSPCIGVCAIDEETGYCKGCFRTVEEVTGWRGGSEAWKRKVWQKLAKRKEEHGEDT